MERFSAQEFFAHARLHRATGFTYVGTLLSLLNKSNPGLVHDHEMKWCVGGGAPATIWNAIENRFGIAVRELYGMTETGGWVSMNTSKHSRFGSVGRARNGVEIAIVGADGAPVEEGKPGEIVARSLRPNVFFDGYWKEPELTAETMVNSWLHTGDLGVIDGDGYLYFVGRLKELIRRGGEMISPVEIELQLLKHPGIQDCAVIGVADEIMGEEIKAMIVPGEPIEPLDVRNFLSKRLPNHMLPRYIAFVRTIPKTATQKIIRHEVAALDAPAIDFRTYTASRE
jgi:acyl-CoA synthetase (AMP-forming)/AMP-acid ligase II